MIFSANEAHSAGRIGREVHGDRLFDDQAIALDALVCRLRRVNVNTKSTPSGSSFMANST